MRILHGAKQSTDTAGGQVVATRWLGEDATFATRPWETSPSYTGGLMPGYPFHTSDAFPVVWRSKHWIDRMLGNLFWLHLVAVLILSRSRVPKINIQDKSRISFCKKTKYKIIVPCESTANEVSFERSHQRISSTDSVVRINVMSP